MLILLALILPHQQNISQFCPKLLSSIILCVYFVAFWNNWIKNCFRYFLTFTMSSFLGNAILLLSSTILNDSCDSDKECAKHYEIELLRALICVEGLTVMFMWTKYIVAVRKFKKDNKKPDVYREDFRRKVLNKWVVFSFPIEFILFLKNILACQMIESRRIDFELTMSHPLCITFTTYCFLAYFLGKILILVIWLKVSDF